MYESLPGTAVHNFKVTDGGVSFKVEGVESSQITLELEPETEYKYIVNDVTVDNVKSTVSGKLSFLVDCKKELQVVQLKRIK